MKRIIIFSFFFLFICSKLISPQSLERMMGWQMQNPTPSWLYYTISFSKGYQVSISTIDPIKGQIGSCTGEYKLNEDELTITMEGKTYVGTITWLTSDKFTYLDGIFASRGSADDEFLTKHMNSGIYGGSPYNSSPYNYNGGGTYTAPKEHSETCRTCYGIGSCRMCHGVGKISNPYNGELSVCSGCGGDGKCWHCKGSRIQ